MECFLVLAGFQVVEVKRSKSYSYFSTLEQGLERLHCLHFSADNTETGVAGVPTLALVAQRTPANTHTTHRNTEQTLGNGRAIFVSFWCPLFSCIFWPSSSIDTLTFRCLYGNWGSDILPQGISKVTADVFRDFHIRLEWMSEALYLFLNVGRTEDIRWRQSFLSIDVDGFHTIYLGCSHTSSRASILDLIKGSGLDQTVALPLIWCVTLGKSFTVSGPQLPHL